MDVRTLSVPGLVRVKPGALDRLGIYLERAGVVQAAVFVSEGLPVGVLTIAALAPLPGKNREAGFFVLPQGSSRGSGIRFRHLPHTPAPLAKAAFGFKVCDPTGRWKWAQQ